MNTFLAVGILAVALGSGAQAERQMVDGQREVVEASNGPQDPAVDMAPASQGNVDRWTSGVELGDLLDDRPQSGSEEAPHLSQFAKVMGWNFTRGLISSENLGPLLAGSGATMLSLPVDDDVSEALLEGNEWVGSSGNVIGSAATLAVSAGTLILISPFTENQKFKSFAFTFAQAGILDSALISLLKLSVPRERPSGENDTSFPSFHAASMTSAATVVQHYYGWEWGIPAYALAGFVSYSRIESERHYLSDVVFGATVGYISAITAIRGTDRSVAQRRLAVVPIIGNQRRGIAVHLEF
jgi:hypothetical protein